MELLYLTDGVKRPLLLDELDAAAAHPALGDAGPLAAEEDHRRVLDECAHHGAGDVGDAGAERADAQAGLAGHPRGRLRHESGAQFVVRRHDRPAAGVGLGEHVHEVRIRNAEQCVDTLGLEEVENAFVNGHTHDETPFIGSALLVVGGGPRVIRTVNG